MSRPCLAAITLGARGGGVAAVSRLLWRAFQERWGENGRLVTLLDEGDGRAGASLQSSTIVRLGFGARVVRLQATGQCDWIFYTHLGVARSQAFIPAPLRQPHAIFIHGIEAWTTMSLAQKRVLRGAALRVANSTFTARRVAALHPDIGAIDACPLALSPNGRLRDADARLDYDPGPRAVLTVARMSGAERYKGHDELLDAWPAVRARVREARLVFAGDGDDVPRLRAKAAALGLEAIVTFTGFVSDRERLGLYRKAAVFAMPSRGEGFGLVYLEAMAEGLPCVGSVEDAAGEIIEDGDTGFLVSQTDREALVDRLVRLLTDEPLRRQMGHSGRRRLQERFSYDQFSRRIMALIDGGLGPAGLACPYDVTA